MKEQNCQNDEVNLMDYIEVVIRQRKVIIGVVVICVAASIGLTFFEPAPVKVYEINSAIRIGSIEGSLLSANEAIAKLENRNLLESVISELGIDMSAQDLKDAIKIEKIADTNLLKLQMQFEKPDTAVKILNKIGDEFISDSNKFYERKIAVIEARIKTLRARKEILDGRIKILDEKMSDPKGQGNYFTILKALTRYEGIYSGLNTTEESLESILLTTNNFEMVNPPAASLIPAPAQGKKQKVVIAAVLGLMLGIFIAFFKEFWKKYVQAQAASS